MKSKQHHLPSKVPIVILNSTNNRTSNKHHLRYRNRENVKMQADKLSFQVTNRTLNITNAVATNKKISSHMVNLQLKAQHANGKTFDIENAWFFKALNIPYNGIVENVIWQCDYLHGIAFPPNQQL